MKHLYQQRVASKGGTVRREDLSELVLHDQYLLVSTILSLLLTHINVSIRASVSGANDCPPALKSPEQVLPYTFTFVQQGSQV